MERAERGREGIRGVGERRAGVGVRREACRGKHASRGSVHAASRSAVVEVVLYCAVYTRY